MIFGSDARDRVGYVVLNVPYLSVRSRVMRRHVPLIVALLSLACGKEPTSPTSPSSTPPPLPIGVPSGPPATMRGGVWDTMNLPVSGAQVQVVAPTRGTVAVTDEDGQFLMPWPFTGTVTVRASKEGFHA